MEITRNHIYGALGISIIVYTLGIFAQVLFGDINTNSGDGRRYLKERKEAVTRNIEDYNNKIAITREPFLSQYKDSLENAVKDTTFLEKEIKIAKKESDKATRKVFSS